MTFLTDCECKLCLDITVDFVRYFYLPLKRFDLLLHFLALSPRLQFMLTHFIMGADLIFKYFETRHFFGMTGPRKGKGWSRIPCDKQYLFLSHHISN